MSSNYVIPNQTFSQTTEGFLVAKCISLLTPGDRATLSSDLENGEKLLVIIMGRIILVHNVIALFVYQTLGIISKVYCALASELFRIVCREI